MVVEVATTPSADMLVVDVLKTETVMVVGNAHWFGEGVNVYVVVALLFGAGDQFPKIPFEEVVGITRFAAGQIGAI